MGRLDGKVALVSGIARGQGRSHAVRLAEEGADIAGFDVCAQLETVPYAMSSREDLDVTRKMVEDLDRRCVALQADARDEDQLRGVVETTVDAFGRIDIVVANAGIASIGGAAHELTSAMWQETISVNLTGVWLTAKVAVPQIIEQQAGGSIILTSSFCGLRPVMNMAHYNSAKHGVVGLMRSMALELAPHSIRVNSVLPTQVDTDMIQNDAIRAVFCGTDQPTQEEFAAASGAVIPLPIPWVEAIDVSNAILWLASDEARYVTGVALPVDGGQQIK